MRARHLQPAERPQQRPARRPEQPLAASNPAEPAAWPATTSEPVAVTVHRLRSRACSLRIRAEATDGPLTVPYRRRASELMLEAWILEVRSGVPVSEIPSAA